jgi:hypothetical protein
MLERLFPRTMVAASLEAAVPAQPCPYANDALRIQLAAFH